MKAMLVFAAVLLLASCDDSTYSGRSNALGDTADCGIPFRLVVVGNSLVSGGNTPAKDGYRRGLHAGLHVARIPFSVVGQVQGVGLLPYPWNQHEGHPSYVLDQFTAEMPGWLATADPTLVVLGPMATVDNALGRPASETIPKVRALVEVASAGGQRAVVLVADLPLTPPSSTNDAFVTAYNAALVPMVADLVSLGHRVVLVDPHDMLLPHWPAWSTDGVHVTDETGADALGFVIAGGAAAAARM